MMTKVPKGETSKEEKKDAAEDEKKSAKKDTEVEEDAMQKMLEGLEKTLEAMESR